MTRRHNRELMPVPEFPDTLLGAVAGRDPDHVYWHAVLAPDRVTLLGMRGKTVIVSAFRNVTKGSPDEQHWCNEVSTALRAMLGKLTQWAAYAGRLNTDYGVEVRLEEIEY